MSTPSRRPKLTWALWFTALCLLPCSGCSSAASQVWRAAYQANYDEAYQAAIRTGKSRGEKEGAAHGAEKAQQAANAGLVWQLYDYLVYAGLFGGAVLGVSVQYAILYGCRLEEKLPSPVLFAFVPAMRSSLCYQIFLRRFQLIADFDAQAHKILAARKLGIAEAKAAYEEARLRIKHASSIQEIRAARLVEIANDDIDRIILEAEESGLATRRSRHAAQGLRERCQCPHCGKKIKFSRKIANTSVACPNHQCGRQFQLPASY